jgi:hypothetical protein
MVSRLAIVALVTAAALAAHVSASFSLGDPLARVRQIQGSPDAREVLPSLGVEIWSWDNASVTFDINTLRVIEWRDPQRVLKVSMRSSLVSHDSVIALGDRLSDIVRIHGTPWALTRPATGHPMYLAYGLSVVRVGTNDMIEGWARRDDMLRVSQSDDALAKAQLGTPPTLGRRREPDGGNPSALMRD